ncbi:glycosyltransferase [Sporolactobacillus shoreicorticis]|nr:glycosyltransferase [Sporolactobacillus shoreicorticis]
MSIHSILIQNYDELELIIVLDCPENSQLRNFLTSISQSEERIHLIMNQRNLGLAESLNKGIAQAKYHYIARMDADDISLPERLDCQMNYMQEKNLDICGTQVIVIDEMDHEKKILRHSTSDYWIKKELRFFDPMIHPTWLVKKSVFDELNGYLPFRISEDYDFLIRAAMKNFKIGNLNAALVKYRRRSGSLTHSKALDAYLTNAYILNKLKNKTPFDGCKKIKFSEEENKQFYDQLKTIYSEKNRIRRVAKLLIGFGHDNLTRIFFTQRILETLSIKMQNIKVFFKNFLWFNQITKGTVKNE